MKAAKPPRAPLPRGFGSLWSTVVLDLIGFGIVLPILPLYTEDLGASPVMVGLVLASYSIAQLLAAPYLGRLSDRYGRRPVLVLSLVGSAVGHVIAGLAGSLWLLIAARALDGFSGGSLSISHAAVSDVASPEERPRLFGLLGAGIAIGFVLGPALGSLAALGGPKLPFFLAAALCGLNAATAWWRLPETRPVDPVTGRRPGEGMPNRAAWREVAATLGQRDRVSRVILVGFVGSLAFSGFEATFALLGRERVGLDVSSTGFVFAGVGVVLAVVQGLLVGKVIGSLGEVRTGRLALGANVVGFALLAPGGGWPLLLLGVGLLTIGQGLLTPAMSTILAGAAPADRRGAIFGVQQSVAAAARVAGPLAGTALFGLAIPAPYVVGVVLCALCVTFLR